jgi:GT2 family glycosyltransferase
MPLEPDKKDFLRFSPFIHPTVMIRRSVLEEGNTYNTGRETLRCEDYELFMRMNKAGYRGRNIEQELFYYREDYQSYRKRKLWFRLYEMRVRYKNFKELGVLMPLGLIYVIRPLFSALMPSRFILHMKQLYHKQKVTVEYEVHEKLGKPIIPIPQNPEGRAGVI